MNKLTIALAAAALLLGVGVIASQPVWSHDGGHGEHGGTTSHPGKGNQGGNGKGGCARSCTGTAHGCKSDARTARDACLAPCKALQDAIPQACGENDQVTDSNGQGDDAKHHDDGDTSSNGEGDGNKPQDDGDTSEGDATEPEGDGVTNTGPSAACVQAIQAFQSCIHSCQGTFQTSSKGCVQTAHTCLNGCRIPAATVPTPHH